MIDFAGYFKVSHKDCAERICMEKQKTHCTAIVLAAGSGKRMKSSTAKQFMLLNGKPLIWYSLQTIELSEIIDDCVLVTGEEDIPFVQQEIVKKYGFRKVCHIVAGGSERYESVYNGLMEIKTSEEMQGKAGNAEATEHYIFIHDGARPFLTEEILKNTYEAVLEHGACVAGMPVKDTIKIADENGFAVETPNRNLVWAVQTPQVFEAGLITYAYEKLMAELSHLKERGVAITDDAFVVEYMLGRKVKLVEASYENIKIITPEDIKTAQGFLD